MEKKIFTIIFGVTLIIIVTSCHKPNQAEKVGAPPLSDTLNATIDSVQTDLFRPGRIFNVNNEYLVVVGADDKGIFKVFSLPKVKFLYDWGRRGKGPNEFLNLDLRSINVNNDHLIIYESNYSRLVNYIVTDTALVLKKRTPISYKNSIMPLNDLQRLNDSVYISDYGIGLRKINKEFVALSPGKNKQPLFTFGEYPKSNLKGPQKYQEFSKTSVAKPNGAKFFTSYFHHNWIKIFDSNGTLLKSIKINNTQLKNKQEYEEGFIYRASLYATDNFIYAYAPNAIKKKFINNRMKPTVEIFNWSGKEINRYQLNKPIVGFTVSEKYHKLYGFSIYKPKILYEFSLPKFSQPNGL